jgi:2,4-dienoyl-CoA reductase-like NADH-dependent reductase (Old Yellow Enzyme family)
VRGGTKKKAGGVFSPGKIAGLRLSGRVIRAGCFEGLSPGGVVTDRLIEHHRALARGGVATTTVGYCAVSLDGRGFETELWMREEILPGLRRLADAVHGYLLSQFLSLWTNHRRDEYGGSLENRLRHPAAVIRRVREAVGPGYPVLVKMNQRDGVKSGLELEEAVSVARRFEAEGASALGPSCGFTAKTPLLMLRGNVPVREMAENRKDPLERLSLRLFVQHYPFEPMFLLEGARRIRDAVGIPVVYVGGVLSLDHMESAVDEGFPFIQTGRATVRDPAFVNKLRSGEARESDCDQCNRCIAAMDAGGVYCVSADRGLMERAWARRP